MRLADFDYMLPRDRIAQSPAVPRDSARLLVLSRADGAMAHRTFRELPEFLRSGDVLVVNNTRVLPARLRGRRDTGGAVELLLLRARDDGAWEALVRPGRRVRDGQRLIFGDGALEATAGPRTPTGSRLVTLTCQG